MHTAKRNLPYAEEITCLSINHLQQQPCPSLHAWLIAKGSLTKKLKALCQAFEVKVLAEGKQTGGIGARIKQQAVWNREVLLCLDGRPWIFARTQIPESLMQLTTADFTDLGSRPLGELLFTQDEFIPGKIDIAQFSMSSELASLATPLLNTPLQNRLSQKSSPAPLWGRHRYFHVGDEQLIVSEVFLPAASEWISQNETITNEARARNSD